MRPSALVRWISVGLVCLIAAGVGIAATAVRGEPNDEPETIGTLHRRLAPPTATSDSTEAAPASTTRTAGETAPAGGDSVTGDEAPPSPAAPASTTGPHGVDAAVAPSRTTTGNAAPTRASRATTGSERDDDPVGHGGGLDGAKGEGSDDGPEGRDDD